MQLDATTMIVLNGQDAGYVNEYIEETLRQEIPTIKGSQIAAAFYRAGEWLKNEGDDLIRYANSFAFFTALKTARALICAKHGSSENAAEIHTPKRQTAAQKKRINLDDPEASVEVF
jgi:hypothetical protein